MRLPDHTLADESFFALPKHNHEGTPTIEYAAIQILGLGQLRLTVFRITPCTA
jgi:hypothetical protein